MPHICILALIGLPAIGKTSFCQWLLSLPSNQRDFNVIHICYDDFIDILPENFDFKKQRLEVVQIVETIILSLKEFNTIPYTLKSKLTVSLTESCNHYLIICDDNNYYRSMRYKLYQLCKRNSLSYAQLYFEHNNMSILLDRDAKRNLNARVTEQVLRKMWERLEPPNANKYIWEARTLILSTDVSDYPRDVLMAFILKSYDSVIMPSALSDKQSAPAQQSVVHHIDLMMRRRIQELIISESSTAGRAENIQRLNMKRKEILKEIRLRDDLCVDDAEVKIILNRLGE